MILALVVGVILNLAIVGLNYVLLLTPRGKRTRLLAYCAPLLLAVVVASLVAAVQAFRGLSDAEERGYRLSLLVLLLGVPLPILGWRRPR